MKEQVDSIKEQVKKIVDALGDINTVLINAVDDIEKISKLENTIEKRQEIEQTLKKLKEKE